MKLRIALGCVILFFSMSAAKAQTATQSTAPSQQSQNQSATPGARAAQQSADAPKIDPAKEADSGN
jgi:hypothetical protein